MGMRSPTLALDRRAARSIIGVEQAVPDRRPRPCDRPPYDLDQQEGPGDPPYQHQSQAQRRIAGSPRDLADRAGARIVH